MSGLGLGKANIETRMLDELFGKPKVLESQKIANETEQQRIAREVRGAVSIRRSSLKAHRSDGVYLWTPPWLTMLRN